MMRILGRILGMAWRGFLWFMFWPIGWYASRQAKNRRRHNRMIRELRRHSTTQPGIYLVHDVQYPPGQLPPPAGIQPLPRRSA